MSRQLTDICWDKENPKIGDELTFSYTVKNQGVVDTPSEFNNLLYIDGELWDLSARGSLAAGESWRVWRGSCMVCAADRGWRLHLCW
jgi:hypothetical protein